MCEANAYLRQPDGREKLVMENVYRLRPEGRRLLLENIFGEQLLLDAELARVSLMEHRLVFQPRRPD
ncbi:MAG: CooT family nickel-binding protein [Deltaproteobacteria bacterium]|nr:CooT family nickel-binding protein [Deltaproteobacteria bacterium]